MLAVALTILLAAVPGAPSPDLDPYRNDEARNEPAAPDQGDPCEEREGWVGDGEDGRAPPACVGPDSDPGADAGGLDGRDGFWREEDADRDDELGERRPRSPLLHGKDGLCPQLR